MAQFNTLLLDRTKWDLVLDSFGNIAMTEPSYALTQDVASAARLFLAELYYDTTKGIPYPDEILGHLPPLSLLSAYVENAALTVPGVVSARCIITTFDNRQIVGQIQFIDETGVTQNANF